MFNLQENDKDRQIMIDSILISISSIEKDISKLKNDLVERKELLKKLGYTKSGKEEPKERKYKWRSYIIDILDRQDKPLSKTSIFEQFVLMYPEINKEAGDKTCYKRISGSYSKMITDGILERVWFERDNVAEEIFGLKKWFANSSITIKYARKLQMDYDLNYVQCENEILQVVLHKIKESIHQGI